MSAPVIADSRPWDRPGWLDAISAWVDRSLAASGRRRVGPLTPFKPAWAGSAVLTAPSDRGRVFFKATAGVPFEAAVLRTLLDRQRAGLPSALALDTGQGWQLLEDFGDTPPASFDDHARVLALLAALQRRETDDLDAWRALGCADRGPSWLAGRIDHLLGTLPGVFARHALLAPADAHLLSLSRTAAVTLCHQLETTLPLVSIHHEDCRPGNAALSATGPLLFDWADTVLAHPYFSAQRYLDDVDAGAGQAADWAFDDGDPRSLLRDAYLAPWRDIAPPALLLDAFTLTRLLNPLYQLARYDAVMDLAAGAASAPTAEARAIMDAVWQSLTHVRPGWESFAQASRR